LVSGSFSEQHLLAEECEVLARVWNLDILEPLHKLRQADGQNVKGLMGDGGGGSRVVATRKEVLLWGRRG
jgi:hypothetical protein